ncbi:MAG: hypothetical protein DRO13_05200 [Thermoprotei archaeon]|nr:MAG: hypothetical protein DRO13_05200 [Thermoprotei archaeon]
MRIVDEIADLMNKYGLSVEKKRSTVKGTHEELPISLVVKVQSSRKSAVIELKPEEDLLDSLADLAESGEDIEEIVDGVLAELRDVAIEVSRCLENTGYKAVLKIREGERDVRDHLEEVLEEYSIFEEE